MPFAIGLLVLGAAIAALVLAPDAVAGSLTGGSSSSTTSTTTGSTGSSGSAGTAVSSAGNGPNGQDQTGWAKDLLTSIGAPLSTQNIKSIVDWENMEGGNWHNTATYNPLNTTYEGDGITGTSINSVNVRAYSSWQQGLQATINTLSSSDYSDIIAALKTGNGLTGDIQGLSTWSGGGYDSIS